MQGNPKKISITSLLLSFYIYSLLTSCSITRYKYTDIQVLHPSSINLPTNIKKFHIIDPCNGQRFYSYNLIKCLNHTIFDSVLKQSFEQSPTFKNIPFVIQNYNELNNEMRNEPSGKHILLKLRCIVNIDTSDFGRDIKYYHDDAFEDAPTIYYEYVLDGHYVIKYKLKIELSDFKTERDFDTFEYADSICFQRSSDIRNDHENITNLLIEIEKVAATKYANHIASYWTTDQRMLYYNSSKLMKIAFQRFNEDDLEAAITLWKEVYKKDKSKLGALAAYNLGLAYEMQDDLEECESWLLKSKQIQRTVLVDNYLNLISKRKSERDILDKIVPLWNY
jgi:hypothetical protein